MPRFVEVGAEAEAFGVADEPAIGACRARRRARAAHRRLTRSGEEESRGEAARGLTPELTRAGQQRQFTPRGSTTKRVLLRRRVQ